MLILADSGYSAQRIPDGSNHAPRYNITYEQLKVLTDEDFTQGDIADMLQVSTRTVERRLK